MKIYQNYAELVGNTPLLRLHTLEKETQTEGRLIAKIERFNPLSSVKDRLAKAMVDDLEVRGLLKKDTVLVEPTSGNTGIGLAFICAAKNIPLIIIMPETVTKERVMTVKALGATVILTEGPMGMKGAIAKAEALLAEHPNYIMPQQFKNLANVEMHRKTTAVEILNDTDGEVAAFVAGVGTGGTITGVGEVLKQTLKDVKIVAVEPYDSSVLSGEKPGSHRIQGIGAGFIPDVLNMKVIDEIIRVTNDEAIHMAKLVAKTEGVFVGISSGAALVAAVKVAKNPIYKNKNIVVVLPDSGERYLSTGVFE
ncbi:cysteine synthase A [Acholeplasma vituli]|uniref:Cysteine synthase A n=1 Tax=Paracholeplasma vituli TaxID=69473 RepID=A0ABT2PZX3_9MOLU|nr:cysteine synthase A [Paracholeplasma vituli]MCU0105287.1 cysteine synthase A [Paracholeplasma vituli]